MIYGAGILFVTPDGQALFLKRGPGGDCPGEWCFPGGTMEDGETAEDTAKREAIEEIGFLPDGNLVPHTRAVTNVEIAGGTVPMDEPVSAETVAAANTPPMDAIVVPERLVDFTTFLMKVPATFEPKINGEHVGFAWAPVNQPPEPLHPGARIALARLTMDELGVAQAIAAGDLTSPQHYMNMWLVAMRITGTGTAYRSALDEFVYRAPENYLTPEFLARCNGLPVIDEHPKGDTLDGKEFSDRAVGTILLPYIKGDEVWGIAKIYDEATIRMLTENQLSTSPAVVFRNIDQNTLMKLEDGSSLLIEGKPSLLDHLAICEQGVWDKGGKPAGVDSGIRGDSDMTEEEKKALEAAEAKKADAEAEEEAKKRADAEAGEKLDKILKGIDSLSKRVDAMEEEAKANKGRKDSEAEEKKEEAMEAKSDEDKEAEEKKADAEKARADSEATRKKLEELEARLPKQMTDADYAAMADAQARADSVFQCFGDSASRPLNGESLSAYRRRLATALKGHSASWKGVDLLALPDAAFDIAEGQIFADAQKSALAPVDLPKGQLRPITRTDSTGRNITTFVGNGSFVSQFKMPTRRVARFETRAAQ